MRSFAEAEAAALDEPAFSNGVEGDAWQANWCDRCVHDAWARSGMPERGCPLLLVALLGKTPSEWLDQWDGKSPFPLGDNYHCVEFRAPGEGGGEPRPKPTPPGQFGLFDRKDFEARRVLVVTEPKHANV